MIPARLKFSCQVTPFSVPFHLWEFLYGRLRFFTDLRVALVGDE